MPSDAEQDALQDILRQIDLARTFTEDCDQQRFSADIMRVYAVTRCLEIISEASRRLSDALKARHPGIPWREIAGAGNVYRHDYQDVVAPRVWDTVQFALPPLRAAIEQEIRSRSTSTRR
jgi:uncharacterized protein with HEPN domain